MTNLVIRLYKALEKRRGLYYSLLIASLCLFITLGSEVEYEEDISKLLPSTQESQSTGFAFNNLKVKDKIFIEFLLKDSTQYNEETYYNLACAADTFANALLIQDTATSYIADLTWQLDDYLAEDALGYLFENVPQFIDSTLYPIMDSALLNREYADSIMAKNVELLSSAQGMFYYNIIQNDPLAIRNVFMEQNKELASMAGGSYKVIEGHFYTPDSTVALAFLSPNFKAFDSKQGTLLVEMLESAIEEFETANPQFEVLFHGAPVQSVFNSRQIKSDLATTLSFSLVLIFLIIWYCFRNKSTILMLLMPVVYGAFFALSGIFIIKGSMSLMALGIGAIVLGVALSYCLHVLTHYKYVSDPVTVLKEQTKPVIMGSITTIGAFAGLLFTKSELLSDFGLFASLGMIGTTFFCLVFLPHAFNPQENRINGKAFRFIEKLNTYPFEKKKWLVALTAIVFAVSLFTGKDVGFDSNLKNIGYNNPDVMRSAGILAEKTTPGMESKYFAVLSKDLNTALEYNISLEKKCRELANEGTIKKYTNSAMLLLPQNIIENRISMWEDFWNSNRVEKTEELLLATGRKHGFKDGMFDPFLNLTQSSYTANSILDAGIIPEGLLANLVEYTDSTYLVFTSVQTPANKMLETSNALVHETEGIPSNSIIVADPFFYTQNMIELLNNDFNTVLGISSLFVLIVLLISFRNIAIAAIAFLPMCMSWYIVLGVMGILGLEFNLINIVISTFIFGIGVDYSIFVMDGLMGKGNPKLLTFHKTAIFFSAVVLVLSIASLMFAVHPAISSIGLSTLIGMASTIAITYILEPFLFNLYMKFRNGKQ